MSTEPTDAITESMTVFTLRVETPTSNADSVRRYLTTPALGLGGSLTEQTRHPVDSNGWRSITNRRVIWEGKLVRDGLVRDGS